MKKIKLIIGAIGLIALVAAIASCGFNPFDTVNAKPGKYEGTFESTKYEFFFTKSSAYKVIIDGSQAKTFYGKGETKDDGYRAAADVPNGKSIKVRYQSGTVADLIEGKDVLYYKRASDDKYVKLEFKGEIPKFETTLNPSKYSYTGKGRITDYNNGGKTEKRPWGDLNTNTGKNVKYELNFYERDKAYLTWEEDGVTKYFWAKEVVYKQYHRVNMTFDELDGHWIPEAGKNPTNLKAGGVKDSKRYAVFDPQGSGDLIFENAPLKKQTK